MTQEKKLQISVFSDRLKALMAERNVWPAIVARECGMPQPVFHRYVAGQFPRVENLVPLANYFGVSMEYLLGVSDERGVVRVREAAKQDSVREPSTPWAGESELRAERDAWRARAESAERQVAALLQVIGRAPEASPQRISTAETIQGVDPEVADTARDGALRASRMLREESLRRGGKTAASTTGSTTAQAGQSAPATGPATGQKAPAQVQSESGKAGSRRPPSRTG